MFDQLLQLVEQHASDSIINNPAIPNQQNSAAIQNVTQQIVSTLQNHASSGNLQQIVSLFQSGGSGALNNHPIVAQLISSVAGNFSSQYGMPQANAQAMASSMLPAIMNQLISKTNNPNDQSFTLTSVMQTVSNSSGSNLQNIMNQFSSGSNSGLLGNLATLASKFFK